MSAALSRFLTMREQLLLGGLAVAILLGAAALYYTGRDTPPDGEHALVIPVDTQAPPPPRPATPAPESAAILTDAYLPRTSPAAEIELGVAVRGEVRRPGFYYLESGDRVNDLIRSAGGLTDAADDSDINLSAHLIDGTTLTIPARRSGDPGHMALRGRPQAVPVVFNPPQYTISGWREQRTPAATGNAGSGGTGASGGLVNLNTATQAELESLPGIGPAYAQRIITFRENQPFKTKEDLMLISGIAEKRFAALENLITVY